MANDKRFIIGSGANTETIDFVSANGASIITVTISNTGTLSFTGNTGQLFSVTDSMTGVIYAVNDVSGFPSIEVDDDGTIRFAEYTGNILIGTNTDNGAEKLQVAGDAVIGNSTVNVTMSATTGDLVTTGNTTVGSNLLDSSARSLKVYDDVGTLVWG